VIDTVRQTTDDDQLLAEQAGKGDHTAFNTLFERYKGRIYRFCLLMLGDEAAASDIYQDVFIRFYRACREGQRMYNVRGYLVTVARTRCISALRDMKRLTSMDEELEIACQPDETVFDTNAHLQQALMSIAPQYREAFLLFELEGYSYDEISRQLEITHDVVKNRIYRAKQALQKILGPLLGGP
jgi:RNA polymerase sigma-70 factor (ECF subfamily)